MILGWKVINLIPHWTKIRQTKLKKFWPGVENLVRRNILSDKILSNKVRSAGTCERVRLRELSVLWNVRLKRFYCIKFVSGAIEIREVEDRCHV